MLKSNPEALRTIREGKGHTGRSLARQSGVSQARISELESAPTPMRPTTALRLARALEVKIAEITTIGPATAEVAS